MRRRADEAANVKADNLGEWAGGLVDDLEDDVLTRFDQVDKRFDRVDHGQATLRADFAGFSSKLSGKMSALLITLIGATFAISGTIIAAVLVMK